MYVCLEYQSILHDKINSACLKKSIIPPMFQALIHPLATRDLAEKHVLKLVEGFFGHCRAV